MITVENFSETNRRRHIGNSTYLICNTNGDSGKWYIIERYNDGSMWAGSHPLYCENIQHAINKLNSFTKEKELVNIMGGKTE